MVTVFKCSAFLPYDAMRVYACYMSVCHKLAHTKITKCRITQTMPYDIPGTLVFWCQKSRRNSTGWCYFWWPWV